MSDLHDLIRACKTDPDDDAPRLILADWLEEHGEPERAAFIRHQIARPDQAGGPEPEPDWFGEWKRWGDEWHATQRFGGAYPVGFVSGFLRLGDYYRELYDRLGEILTYDWTWLEGITFGSWHDGDWSPLFRSPRLLELTRLHFIDDQYRSALVEPLSVSPCVESLRHLLLYMVVVGDDGIERLSQSNHLSRLRSLELSFAQIGSTGAGALARSEAWGLLRSLHLRANPLGDQGLLELATGQRRQILRSLDIAHCRHSDDGLVEFAKSNRFPNLAELWLGCSHNDSPAFGRDGLEAVLTSHHYRATTVRFHFIGNELPHGIEMLGQEYPDRLIIDRVDALS